MRPAGIAPVTASVSAGEPVIGAVSGVSIDAGRHAVHPDRRRVLHRRGLGEADDAGLRRRVRPLAGDGAVGVERRHVDDRPAAAGQQVRHGGAQHVERARQVHVDERAPLLVGVRRAAASSGRRRRSTRRRSSPPSASAASSTPRRTASGRRRRRRRRRRRPRRRPPRGVGPTVEHARPPRPRPANRRHVAAPMPEPPPVTSTLRPSARHEHRSWHASSFRGRWRPRTPAITSTTSAIASSGCGPASTPSTSTTSPSEESTGELSHFGQHDGRRRRPTPSSGRRTSRSSSRSRPSWPTSSGRCSRLDEGTYGTCEACGGADRRRAPRGRCRRPASASRTRRSSRAAMTDRLSEGGTASAAARRPAT